MAYLVNKSNGELLATILDGQTNSVDSSIVLIGKQVTNYGELQNENFVHILENFANSTDPGSPLAGQLWWNTSTKTMQVFDGTLWRPATGFTSANTTPSNSYIGDQWYDTINEQYKVYSGSQWLTVGPAYSALDGTSGAIVENVYDTSLVKHTVVKVYHNGNVTAIISRDAAFTPNVTIGGFTTVRPGISFTANVDAIKYYGTATNSDTLGNLTPSQFLRSDVDTVGTGRLTIENQVDIGQNSELNISVNGLGQVIFKNIVLNQDTIFRANVGGILQSALTIQGADGRIVLAHDPVDDLGAVTKQYHDNGITTLRSDVNDYFTINVAALNNSITTVQANLTASNVRIADLETLKAPLSSPVLTGVPTVPTAPSGTSNLQIASTEFVSNAISIFDPTEIYNGSSKVHVNSSNVVVTVSSTTVATITNNGIETITQAASDGSTKTATTAYVDRGDKNFVRNSTKYQPTCYVSTQVPDNNVGSDGDFWFQYS